MASDREILAPLGRFERFSYRLARFCNRNLKWLYTFYQQQILGIVFPLCVGRVVRPVGLEHAQAIPNGKPILLVSNHRSFFDFYTLSTVLYKNAGVGRYIYFPVRANFFYDSLLGLVINNFVGGWSMYPPLFRERKKLGFNRYSTEETARLLQEPKTLVGIHPEGTRNKGDDPYKLLPAQPGVGRVAMLSKPSVLPVFILGMGNSFPQTVKNNWTHGRPIYIVFGPPIDLEDLYAEGDRPAVHKRIADRILEVIRGLGEKERELRAAAGLPSLAPVQPAQPQVARDST
jgi:1-acyl-sn-glycerol-3-phosphate acyltransferase